MGNRQKLGIDQGRVANPVGFTRCDRNALTGGQHKFSPADSTESVPANT
jgi:hypothetical protein